MAERLIEGLPDDTQKLLQTYVKGVKGQFGELLEGVLLYGSAIRGEFLPGRSNLNILLLVSSYDSAVLKQYSTLHRQWSKEQTVAPLFLTEEELRISAEVFPLEFIEIQEQHRVLGGRDPFIGFHVKTDRLKEAVVQGFMSHLLRLRQRYLEGNGTDEATAILLPLSITSLLPLLRGVQLLELLEKGILLVDEAYFEFAKITMAGLLDGYPHLVVSRTFSKAFGLAGLRCGYILADEACVRLIDKIRNGKDVNALAQVAAAAALEDTAYMERFVAEALAAKLWLAGRLHALGFEVVTTPANFLLLKTREPRSLARELEDRGVFIRDRSGVPQLDRCLRITVGSFEHCRRLMEILERLAPES